MTGKADFTGIRWWTVEWTMLCTLYLRAYESRSPHSILGDHAADEAVRRIDYDFTRMRWFVRPSGNQYLVALRARQLDLWASDFLARHRDAVVLHLGCGLDSRAFRLDLPAGTDWFDLDLPDVIALRRKIYDEHDRYRMIASSVTEPEWLDRVPADRPVLVVAEGLLPYLTEEDVRRLLRRLTGLRHGRAALRRDGAVDHPRLPAVPVGTAGPAAARTVGPPPAPRRIRIGPRPPRVHPAHLATPGFHAVPRDPAGQGPGQAAPLPVLTRARAPVRTC